MHAWRIEEREYARHEQRRGRRHAFSRIDPARTALVVIDMVPFFLEEMEYGGGIVPNVARLATVLREAGGTVAWVVPGSGPRMAVDEEFHGSEAAEAYRRTGGKGPVSERLWHEFEVADSDMLVEKTAASAFFPGRSPLSQLLRGRGVDTVLITGVVTNVCCESSARDASTLGFRVILVADATAARRDEDHNATLHTIYRSFGDVRPSDDVIGLIEAGSSRARGPAT